MSFVRPFALAACMSLASAISFAQQAPADTTTTQSTTTTSQTQTTPPANPAAAPAMTESQKAALKTCVADETAKNDGSTAAQIKQTCATRVAANPQG